ncbi:hypothetical protein EDD37DRAFT_633707 [Exophiala viscosa]|uniref:Uncharacterized protein n=1 Tax=Exophiala viscosa TaxID=2486360 RepID=A0AAN6DV74_9EURO|nr:hypothetical protein EDD36DRAFT_274425 [Exophiala viscosa]KAI1623054.1 hypothetical protein EDD37DRAFT_633707 [Exophiala viscosa]
MAAVLSTRSLDVGKGLEKRVENVTIRDISATEVPQPAQTDYQDRNGRPQWLTVSPYLEPEHLLDLRTLDTPNRLLALALTTLIPATTEYATIRYEDAFDWAKLMSSLRSLAKMEGYRWTHQELYVVEFRSKLKADIDVDLLLKLDKFSHAEATHAGNLLKYWYGVPSPERRNLATCLWRSKEDAILGGTGPWHKQARGVISAMYEQIDVKGLRLTIEDDIETWSFAPY